MADTVEFILKLKDMASRGVQQFGATAATSFGRAGSEAAKMQSRMQTAATNIAGRVRTMGSSINELRNKLEDVNRVRFGTVLRSEFREATREANRLERQIARLENRGRGAGGRGGAGAGGGILGMFGGMRGAALGLAIAGGAAIGGSIGSGMQGGAQQVSFEVMGGQKEGGQLYKDLTKFANDSIFGKEVYQNAQTALAFGASVKDVMPDMKMLGDISMGNKEKLGSLNLAYNQIRATGRLMGQDLLQLINAGFNPLQIISGKTGQSMAELKKKMEQGAISFGMVKDAFVSATSEGGRFFKMTEKIAATPFGKWEAFKGQIQGVALEFGTALLPVVSRVIDGLSYLVGYIPPLIHAFEPLFNYLGALPIGDFFQTIVNGATAIGATLLPVFQELKPVVTVLLTEAMNLGKKIIGMAVPAFQKLAPILGDVAHIAGVILVPALKIVGWQLGKVVDIVGWLVDKLAWLLKPIVKLFTFVADGVGWMLDKAAGAVERKTPVIAEKLKEGINKGEVTAFFGKVGQLHGNAYVEGATAGIKRLAIFMDKLHGTNAFTNKFAEMFGGASMQEVTVTGKKAASKPFGSGGGFSGLTDTNDKISGGGPQVITINIKDVIGTLQLNSYNLREGVGEIERVIEEGVRRVLYSAANS